MAALLVVELGEVRRHRRLHAAHEETVGEPAARESLEGRQGVLPFRLQGESVAARHVAARAPGVVRADLEAGREDEAIHGVLLTRGDDGVRQDPFDAFSIGVDERHVGAFEGREVVVVEARALAELAVVGLEAFGGHGVLDVLVHPASDRLHLLEISKFHPGGDLFGRSTEVPTRRQPGEIPDDVGPAIVHEVDFLEAARDQGAEVFDPFLLPTRRQLLSPFRIGRPISAHVDR